MAKTLTSSMAIDRRRGEVLLPTDRRSIKPKDNVDRTNKPSTKTGHPHNTFIARVVEHKIANLIKAQKAGIRDYRRCRCSLNDRFEDEDGRSVERIDTLDQERNGPHTGTQSRPSDELRFLAIDMGFVLETLPPELRDLCQRLVAETVTEISRSTGVPRGTIYESIKRLRKIFRDAGLKDYL